MNYKEYIVDYVSGNLSEEEKQVFEKFLTTNSVAKEEVEKEKRLWNELLSSQPEPSENMDTAFYKMLHSQEDKEVSTSFLQKIERFFASNLSKQLTYGLAVLTLGFFFGKSFQNAQNPSQEIVKSAQKETENVRSQLVLTLLEQPSANKRLQAVNEVNKLSSVTETIIKALFSTLNNDESVNVRLSAVEALKKYTDIPLVREGLVKSIIHQNSPIVQMELADVMVVLQEKKAVKSFKKLIEEKDVNSSAKQKMQESIQNIY